MVNFTLILLHFLRSWIHVKASHVSLFEFSLILQMAGSPYYENKKQFVKPKDELLTCIFFVYWAKLPILLYISVFAKCERIFPNINLYIRTKKFILAVRITTFRLYDFLHVSIMLDNLIEILNWPLYSKFKDVYRLWQVCEVYTTI